jgi:hypothetical protein
VPVIVNSMLIFSLGITLKFSNKSYMQCIPIHNVQNFKLVQYRFWLLQLLSKAILI